MTDLLGNIIGLPFILAGYLLSLVAEGLVRLGAWLAGRQVIESDH